MTTRVKLMFGAAMLAVVGGLAPVGAQPAAAACNDILLYSRTSPYYTDPRDGQRKDTPGFGFYLGGWGCLAGELGVDADTNYLLPGANNLFVVFDALVGEPPKDELIGFIDLSQLGGYVGEFKLPRDVDTVTGDPLDAYQQQGSFEIDPTKIGCLTVAIEGQENRWCTPTTLLPGVPGLPY